MVEQDRPGIRVWRWVDLSPAGQRAYVLMYAVKLLRSRGSPIPESWLDAWRHAGQSMQSDQPRAGDVPDASIGVAGVDTQVRLTSEEWARVESLSAQEPIDWKMIHKAAIEYRLSDRGVVPAGLVDVTRALVEAEQ